MQHGIRRHKTRKYGWRCHLWADPARRPSVKGPPGQSAHLPRQRRAPGSAEAAETREGRLPPHTLPRPSLHHRAGPVPWPGLLSTASFQNKSFTFPGSTVSKIFTKEQMDTEERLNQGCGCRTSDRGLPGVCGALAHQAWYLQSRDRVVLRRITVVTDGGHRGKSDKAHGRPTTFLRELC